MLTTTAAGRTFDYSHCLGMYGMSGLGFWAPLDFAFGANGVLYVVNRGGEELGQRISKCTIDHKFLGQFGGYGSGDGQFIWPVSIALDQDENLFPHCAGKVRTPGVDGDHEIQACDQRGRVVPGLDFRRVVDDASRAFASTVADLQGMPGDARDRE